MLGAFLFLLDIRLEMKTIKQYDVLVPNVVLGAFFTFTWRSGSGSVSRGLDCEP